MRIHLLSVAVAVVCQLSSPAQAAQKKLGAVLQPDGSTSQISENDASEIREVIENDLNEALAPLEYMVLTGENARKTFKAFKIDPEKVEKSESIKEYVKNLKLSFYVFCLASSQGEKHNIMVRAYGTGSEDGETLAATDISGKNLGGLKRSWSAKKEKFIEALKTRLSPSAPQATAEGDDDADAAAKKALAKQESKDLKKLCDSGNGAACTGRGYMYESGDGVRKNRATARELYEKGCGRADALGCMLLARMYITGNGVEKDKAKAVEFADKACKLGFEPACPSDQKKTRTVNAY